jgi:O-methyltransferase
LRLPAADLAFRLLTNSSLFNKDGYLYINPLFNIMASITPAAKVLIFLKRINVNGLYRKIEKVLPARMRSTIRGMINKQLFAPNVNEVELRPAYAKSLKLLSDKTGPENLGDYLEFGVSHGTSLATMHVVLKKMGLNNVRIFGFDSFEGMPAGSADEEGSVWFQGEFRSTIDETKQFLSLNGVDWKRTFLIKGWFNETCTPALVKEHRMQKASVIMIDCDIYTSSKIALDFCRPLIKGEAIILFDDWMEEDKNVGEYRALKEFLEENPSLRAQLIDTYEPKGKIFLVEEVR